MRKKLYKNLTTLVLTFALVMGTLIGTTMDVLAANDFKVDITATAEQIQNVGGNITLEFGDSITGINFEGNDMIMVWLQNGYASTNQRDYGSIRSNNNSLYFPDEITLGGKTYKNPK